MAYDENLEKRIDKLTADWDLDKKKGPSLQWHLGGGPGGIHHFMEHLMGPLEGMMKVLGTPNITPDLKQTVANEVMRIAGNRTVEQLAAEENEVLTELLSSRAKVGL